MFIGDRAGGLELHQRVAVIQKRRHVTAALPAQGNHCGGADRRRFAGVEFHQVSGGGVTGESKDGGVKYDRVVAVVFRDQPDQRIAGALVEFAQRDGRLRPDAGAFVSKQRDHRCVGCIVSGIAEDFYRLRPDFCIGILEQRQQWCVGRGVASADLPDAPDAVKPSELIFRTGRYFRQCLDVFALSQLELGGLPNAHVCVAQQLGQAGVLKFSEALGEQFFDPVRSGVFFTGGQPIEAAFAGHAPAVDPV